MSLNATYEYYETQVIEEVYLHAVLQDLETLVDQANLEDPVYQEKQQSTFSHLPVFCNFLTKLTMYSMSKKTFQTFKSLQAMLRNKHCDKAQMNHKWSSRSVQVKEKYVK